MKKFIFYIEFLFLFFNAFSAIGDEITQISPANNANETYEIRDFTVSRAKKIKSSQPSLIQTDSELIRMVLVPIIADKLFPNNEIYTDMTGFLSLVYPNTNIDTLHQFEEIVRWFVTVKRKHEFVIKKIKHNIRAARILPQDAPVIAENGEFAPEFTNKRKLSGDDDNYQVSYTPYKYVEYDKGDLGEPVRLRDKNYISQKYDPNEILLAILTFDIPGFINAVRKLPKKYDGSAEKMSTLADNMYARLVMEDAEPGDKKKLRGVIDIILPPQTYINGDFLNQETKPKFVLTEDNNVLENVAGITVFHPLATGVTTNDGKARRILTNRIQFPFEVERSDITKATTISGRFGFELCAADGSCAPVVSNHLLTIKPSDKHEFSQYTIMINNSFDNLPKNKTSHARLTDAVYNKQTNKLKVRFDTSRSFSNTAIMVEDTKGTSFLNPKYQIHGNNVTAEFDVVSNDENAFNPDDLGEIAVSASFDDKEVLREVMDIKLFEDIDGLPTPLSPLTAFLFGLILCLFPGASLLFAHFAQALRDNNDKLRIVAQYAMGAFFGLTYIGYVVNHKYFWSLYENLFLLTAMAMVIFSYLTEDFSHMDFNLFRPLKIVFRRGTLAGLFVVLLASITPIPFKFETFSSLYNTNISTCLYILFLIWLGMIVLPLIVLLCCRIGFMAWLPYFRRIFAYMAIFCICFIFWLVYAQYNVWALVILIFCLMFVWILWYIFPIAVDKTLKHVRAERRRKALFFTVQRHALLAMVILYLLTILGLNFFKLKQPEVPSFESIQQEANTHLQDGKPFLVLIGGDWSFISLMNRYQIRSLVRHRVTYKNLTITGDAKNILPWMINYQKNYPPLNILFTTRHKMGIILPDKVREIHFDKALKEW